MSVSICDFGSTVTFEMVAAFRPNVEIDPTGRTPDLASPLGSSNTVNPHPPLYAFTSFPFSYTTFSPISDATVVAVVQFLPRDAGTLQIGADTTMDMGGPTGDSAFTQDNYNTPAISMGNMQFGINLNLDVSRQCLTQSQLRLYRTKDAESGDFTSVRGPGTGTIDIGFALVVPSVLPVTFFIFNVTTQTLVGTGTATPYGKNALARLWVNSVSLDIGKENDFVALALNVLVPSSCGGASTLFMWSTDASIMN
jgi:hypothetical protein